MTARTPLTWLPITERPDLLAEPVRAALHASPLADRVEVAEIDPDLADTQALVAAIPRVDLAGSLPEGLPGEPPSPTRIPAGCAFLTEASCGSAMPARTAATMSRSAA